MKCVGGILCHRIYSAYKDPEVNLEMVKYERTAGEQSERMYVMRACFVSCINAPCWLL